MVTIIRAVQAVRIRSLSRSSDDAGHVFRQVSGSSAGRPRALDPRTARPRCLSPPNGALNPRGLDERAAIELAHAHREQCSLALVILDIDYFKQVNDEWGHDTDDLVLAALARLLASLSREIDAVARIEGEEFVVLMRGASTRDADAFAERIRGALADPRLQNKLPMIRVSAGVAADDPSASSEALLQAADRGLYTSKRNGRSRTVIAADHSETVAAASRARP